MPRGWETQKVSKGNTRRLENRCFLDTVTATGSAFEGNRHGYRIATRAGTILEDRKD